MRFGYIIKDSFDFRVLCIVENDNREQALQIARRHFQPLGQLISIRVVIIPNEAVITVNAEQGKEQRFDNGEQRNDNHNTV